MKNLIIVHLESLSESLLKQYADCFPNLQEIAKESIRFTNYYGSATSTYMIMLDLFLGGDYGFEKCDYLENVFAGDIKTKASVMDILEEYQYYCKSFFLHFLPEDLEIADELEKIICNHGEYWAGDDGDAFREELQKSINPLNQKPFALFVCDNYSHIGYTWAGEENNINSITHWIKDRYSHIDRTLGIVRDAMADPNIRKNTIILIYGDHGEEYWSHGLHEGYTHAIEPYTDIIHCPLLLFDGENAHGSITDELISTVDLRDLVLDKIGIAEAYTNHHDYVFSRNLFAHQTRRADVFQKSYAATDGDYTLILTNHGYSLFLNRIDPTNHCNLLDFFQMRGDGKLQYIKDYDQMLASHFHHFMTDMVKEEICCKFEEMKKALDKYAYQICGVAASFGRNIPDRSFFRNREMLNQLKRRNVEQRLKKKIRQYIPQKQRS